MSGRGVCTIGDLYARSERRAGSACWHWLGACSGGTPRIWTFDHDRGEKRVLTGPMAVWNIANQSGSAGRLIYRACGSRLCVTFAHHRAATSKATMFAALKADGRYRGTHVAARRANMALAHVANGITPTSISIVLAIRAAGLGQTGLALAAQHGIAHTTVSRIRRGESRQGVA